MITITASVPQGMRYEHIPHAHGILKMDLTLWWYRAGMLSGLKEYLSGRFLQLEHEEPMPQIRLIGEHL